MADAEPEGLQRRPNPAVSDAVTAAAFQQQAYANPHIERVINGTFAPSSDVLQHVSDGSNLTSSALLDPSNPLTIDRPILITDAPESIGMRVPRGAPMSPRKAASVPAAGESLPSKKKRVTIREIGELVGMSVPVTVMDVQVNYDTDV